MYKNVYKLNPACYLIYNLREKRIEKKARYWRLHVCSASSGKRKKSDIIEDLRFLISESVKEQMVADVEVGTFLSGGIDSSIITYESYKYNKNVFAYSIGFEEKKCDESSFSKLFANKYNINQKLKMLSTKDVGKLKGELKKWYDEPFADTSAFPTYIVSEFARRDVKVVLTGDGGDELFGGYTRYRLFCKYLKEKNIVKSKNINCLLDQFEIETDHICSQMTAYSKNIGFFDKEYEKNMKKKYHIDSFYNSKWYLQKYYNPDLPPLTRMRYLDFKTYLPSDILTKVDRTSMSVSLEARVPFLNRKIVEYVFGLAEDECCSSECLKRILKEAYAETIPEEILYRKKKGFSIPDNYVHISADCKSRYEEILKREWKELFDYR